MLKDSISAVKSLKKLRKKHFLFHTDVIKIIGIRIKFQTSMSLSDINFIK